MGGTRGYWEASPPPSLYVKKGPAMLLGDDNLAESKAYKGDFGCYPCLVLGQNRSGQMFGEGEKREHQEIKNAKEKPNKSSMQLT